MISSFDCRRGSASFRTISHVLASLANIGGRDERKRRGLPPDPDMELRHLGWLDMVLPAQGVAGLLCA
ncbi:hypothetical protein ACH4T9_30130 [Micromonospora sp. NPDC020750]|uniref:hypothetical protein n=1 Tax=unclassified Micromonospora TaxID=2617518 RepID=UPI00378BF2EA